MFRFRKLKKRLKNLNKSSVTFKNLKQFLKTFLMPYIGLVIISLIFMIFFAAANTLFAWSMKPIVNGVMILKNYETVFQITALLLGVSLIKGVSQYIYMTTIMRAGAKILANVKCNLYSSFIHQDLSFHKTNSPSALITVLINDIRNLETFCTEIPINIGRDLMTFLGLLIMLMIQNFIYALVVIATIFIIYIPYKKLKSKNDTMFKNNNLGMAQFTNHCEQNLSGIKEVKAYQQESQSIIQAKKIANNIAKSRIKMSKLRAFLPSFMEIISGSAIAIIFLFAGIKIVTSHLDPGEVLSFIVALLLIYQPLKKLTTMTFRIKNGLNSINRYYQFTNNHPTIVEKADAVNLPASQSLDLEFKNVNFQYNKNTATTLNNINFKIHKGEKIGLVGESGGGKSTLFNLIIRFYDIETGEILINNQNIKNITLQSLRDSISLVNQETVLFDDTIYNNIQYANPNATKDQITQICKDAMAYDFIQALPQQFNTMIGHRGTRLSGGQRQRIAIARAMLKNAPILLLDEATSALDSINEHYIQKALHTLMEGKTTLIIAHRLSTIKYCDKILVIQNGNIVETGTHQELHSKQNGEYKKLYDTQFSQYNDNKELILSV